MRSARAESPLSQLAHWWSFHRARRCGFPSTLRGLVVGAGPLFGAGAIRQAAFLLSWMASLGSHYGFSSLAVKVEFWISTTGRGARGIVMERSFFCDLERDKVI